MDFRGGGEVRPPPLKSAKKTVKSVSNFAIIVAIWWLKLQNFLSSRRSPSLLKKINNIINIEKIPWHISLLNLHGSYCTGRGRLTWYEMHDVKTLKKLNCRTGLDVAGDFSGPQTPRRTSPSLIPQHGTVPVAWKSPLVQPFIMTQRSII